ncbi:MAG: hypothetical protein PHG84_05605 [Endomicrobiaceae bacterium]|nr:hypothetical protein [Endomicrobiaceae bacterium]MDD3053855.1 hypothetical protein [Endomicrobiaceae bacterium]MDD3923026.1 hypothetical protein [Endomicrobiaceae bacterium]MDD5101659.1 hypothetical protein [Endomicrobiaceae bacterium]
MNRNRIILLLASMTTLILGPGAGHLIIKEWKRAIFFIVLAAGLFAILGIAFISEVGQETLAAVANYENLEKFKNIYNKFQDNNPKMMLFFDIFFAALWAYSVVDIFIVAKNKGMLKK